MIAVGPIDHIPSKGFGGIQAVFFVGLADADEGIGPGFVGGANFLAGDDVVVDNNLGFEAAVFAGTEEGSLEWIPLLNKEAIAGVDVEHCIHTSSPIMMR